MKVEDNRKLCLCTLNYAVVIIPDDHKLSSLKIILGVNDTFQNSMGVMREKNGFAVNT